MMHAEVLRDFDEFAASANELQQLCGCILATRQHLLQLLQQCKDLREMNQSFNLQYLTLQQNMQDESRRFTLLSNIMKSKHDGAKNAISNLR
jgi:hypothetical protein